MKIDTALAQALVREQFPKWADLPIAPVAKSGWDNRTFHLGDQMTIRMPSDAAYASQVGKEQHWLPILARELPLDIPIPIVLGEPGCGYPWQWSIYQWINGETASSEKILDMGQFSKELARFLLALQKIKARGGPPAGAHNFFRGGPLVTYDAEVQRALYILSGTIDTATAQSIWETALSSEWQKPPVWVHGDVSPRNLLVEKSRLVAVIDFGCLGVGDPACDLVMSWTFFDRSVRKVFRQALPLDKATWARARGWALWKALIVHAQLPGTDPKERDNSSRVIEEVMADFISDR
jgi:aminoglycoside phosphotransferase (APT) family kinase protein